MSAMRSNPFLIRDRDRHLANDGRPKRILALDGGGLRGILSLALLQKMEDVLRLRHADSADFRLCHYFDLIAGTSTGAIIAATLAMGWTVEEIRRKYVALGKRVFEKSLLRKGLLRAKYDEARLIAELKKVYGAATRLGGPELGTGLLVVTKRMDTGSPWPISNNPRGQFFKALPGGVLGNGDYPCGRSFAPRPRPRPSSIPSPSRSPAPRDTSRSPASSSTAGSACSTIPPCSPSCTPR